MEVKHVLTSGNSNVHNHFDSLWHLAWQSRQISSEPTFTLTYLAGPHTEGG